jgi:DNA polymerase I-like protein with 3'-5' exonuclease and polymerase domains
VTVAESLTYLQRLDEVYLDTETTGLDPLIDKVLLLQLGDKDKQFVVDISTVNISSYKALIERKVIVIHNAKFDLGFLMTNGIWPQPGNIRCTYLQEKILTHGKMNGKIPIPCDLGTLAKNYLDIELDKSVRTHIKEGLTDRVIKYSGQDIEALEIHQHQKKLLEEQDLLITSRLENKYVFALAYIELCGMPFNAETWKKKCAHEKLELKAAKEKLDSYLLADIETFDKWISREWSLFSAGLSTRINWDSPTQVMELFAKIGIVIRDKHGKQTVESKILKLHEREHPIIADYVAYKQRAKDESTYGLNWIAAIHSKTGRLHTTFRQLLNTGRISSGDAKAPVQFKRYNFQNLPKTPYTRESFESKDGVIISADYSGQENIVIANLTEDPNLIQFYKNGETDMHSFVCQKIASVSNVFNKEIVTLSLKDIKAKYPNERDVTKKAVFAMNYGGNGYTIAENVGVSEGTGRSIYEAYYKAFPGLKMFADRVANAAVTTGYIIINKFTKRRYNMPEFEDFKVLQKCMDMIHIYDDDRARDIRRKYYSLKGAMGRQGMNFPIQGTAADMTKIATILFVDWLISKDYLFNMKVKIINTVHDEIVVECPEDISESVAQMLNDCMVKAGGYFCQLIPIKVGIKIAKVWSK